VSTVDIIIELFCRVDDQMPDARKHSQAALHPSEVVIAACTQRNRQSHRLHCSLIQPLGAMAWP